MKTTCKNQITGILVAAVLLIFWSCIDHKPTVADRKMPGGSVPEKLFVLDMKEDLGWADKNMLTCFQGLVNRKKTRIYYNSSENDQFWLEYYRKSFGIGYEKVSGERRSSVTFQQRH